MLSGMDSLFTSGKYSDLTISCDGLELPTHRAIVCPQSQFFAAACEGDFQEGSTRKIELAKDDPDTVRRMLSYLYTQDYEDGEALGIEDNEVQSAEATFEPSPEGPCGERSTSGSGIQEGTEQSEKQYEPMFNIGSSVPIHAERSAQLNHVLTYALAEKYNIAGLKKLSRSKFVGHKWSNWARELPTVVKTIYESTPSSDRGLRDA
ncbi:MAG: hypothetical protein M1830_001259, partial [Pleopsidium flavum]